MRISLGDMGLPIKGTIVIFRGKDEISIGRMLVDEGFVTPATKIHTDPRLKEGRK